MTHLRYDLCAMRSALLDAFFTDTNHACLPYTILGSGPAGRQGHVFNGNGLFILGKMNDLVNCDVNAHTNRSQIATALMNSS